MKALKYCVIGLFCILFVLVSPKRAKAEDRLSGRINIDFDSASGTLTAKYEGTQRLTNPTYTWYLNNAAKTNGYSMKVTASGGYYVTLTDSVLEGSLISTTTIIYKVTAGSTGITLDSNTGYYRQGDTVTATVSTSSNQKVTDWKLSVSGVGLSISGNSATFTMPAANVTITCTVKSSYTIHIYGGTADKYVAYVGDTVTVTASEVDGKKFKQWVCSGTSVLSATEKISSFTMPSTNVTIRAEFEEETEKEKKKNDEKKFTSAAENDTWGQDLPFSDPSFCKYTVTRHNNYKVRMYHYNQGPLCDAAFKLARGADNLILNYFNLVINDNLRIYETPGPVTVILTIPEDLQKEGRNWRMICISRYGYAYSFPDQDEDDATITFSPDRFYAFAMAFNDIPKVEEEMVVEAEEESETEPEPESPTSMVHSASESQTGKTPEPLKVDETQTGGGGVISTTVTETTTVTPVDSADIGSDKKAAIEAAGSEQIGLLSM